MPLNSLPTPLAPILAVSACAGLVFAVAVLAKSLTALGRTGPQLTREVMTHFRGYLLFSLARLTLFAWAIATLLALVGVGAYALGTVVLTSAFSYPAALLAAFAGIATIGARQFLHTLYHSPGVIVASSNYAMQRFYGLWERLSVRRLLALDLLLAGGLALWVAVGLFALAGRGAWTDFWGVLLLVAAAASLARLAGRPREPKAVRPASANPLPNILLIGSDTLRADRVGGTRGERALTPALDRLAQKGAVFDHCYVPCARTAPSIVSMLTGAWPHSHGIRDNFPQPDRTRLPMPVLPKLFKQAGYRTAAVGDWAASDLDKFDLGFDCCDLPPDQWNLKFLLRQGPKDIRLFLSLFSQGRFGKRFLPEIHYLAGVPLTREVGRDTRHRISQMADCDEPFFLMSFMASTHPPFASRYPYYTLYTDPPYRGPSKFAMARLTDPFEIIRRQGEPRKEFDLDQILDLYDGCVRSFDDEVARICAHLDACGIADNTIVVIFSDHGMEFFEHETWGQGNSAIGDYSARVPLIIADPRASGGCRVSQVVRSVDLAPTLLDLAGLPIPGGMAGVSLAPLLRGAAPPPELPAFCETGIWLTDLPGTPAGHLRYPKLPELLEIPDKKLGTIALKPEYEESVVRAKDRMVRIGDWKLTYQPLAQGALWKLFDLRTDPECRNDVIGEHPEVAADLRARLEAWMAGGASNAPLPGAN